MGLNNNNNTTTTATTTTTAMIGIKIKNEMNNEIRKLSIDKDITFILFKQNILNIFGLNNVNSLKFTYKDEDDDDIILSNDGEWKIATLNASNILKISFTFSNEKEHKEIEKVEKAEIEKVEIEKVEKVEKVEIEKVEKVEIETIPLPPLPTLPQTTTTTTTTSNDHHHQHHHHWRNNNNNNFHQNQNQNQNPNRFFFKRGPEGKELKHRIQLARKTNNIEQLLDIFTELGFDDREFNRKLLIENNNKIRKCFAQLMTNANTTVIPNTNPNENTNENVTPTENGNGNGNGNGNWNHGNWKKHHHSNQHPFFKKGFEQKVLKDRIKLAKKTNNVETLLDILNEFGFNDREGNRKLLQQNNNKIRKCVKILLSNNPDVVVKQPSWNYDPIVNYNINFKNYA